MYSNKTIIILDSCNYDIFKSVIGETNFIGDLSIVNVGVSTTQQWYNKYWNSEIDRILISENPMPFHKGTSYAHCNFIKSYKSFGINYVDIDPQKTIDIYKSISKDKTLIHFLPPHLPFIYPEEAVLLMNKLKNGNIYRNTQNWASIHGFTKLKEYYRSNIKNMLILIYDNLHLFEDLVITSDHGELIGYKNRQYDHPSNPNDEQKEILHNVPYYKVDIDETLLLKRMRMLGYD